MTDEYTDLFSVYKRPITNTIPYKAVSVSDVYKVLTSTKYKGVTEALRKLNGNKASDTFKETKLDYATFAGIFSKRADNCIKTRSNYFHVDLDHVADIPATIKKILADFTPVLIFTSPRGNGLKVIYLIDPSIADHLTYFLALQAYYKREFDIDIDRKCKDPSRACFLCYDPGAFYSDTPTILGQAFLDTFQKVIPSPIQAEPTQPADISTNGIYDRLKVWLNKQETFTPGNRNNYVTKLTCACNNYGIPRDEMEGLLREFVQEDFTQKEIEATVKSIYQNKSAEHNKKKFNNSRPYKFPAIQEKTPGVPPETFYSEETEDMVTLSEAMFADLQRVGDHFFKLITMYDKRGNPFKVIDVRMRQTIIDDWGKKALKYIKKYDAFVNVPSHTDYMDISVMLTPLIGLIQRTDVKLTLLPIFTFS